MVGFRDVVTEIMIHRRMVAGDDDACVVIEILCLNPAYKFADLPGSAVKDIRILVIRVSILAEAADISVRKVCIHRKQGQVERFVLFCKCSEFLSSISEELFVFKAPVNPVVFREFILSFPVTVVFNLDISVVFHEEFSPAEVTDGTEEELLCVAFFCQNVSECSDGGKEMFLTVHRVLFDGNL